MKKAGYLSVAFLIIGFIAGRAYYGSPNSKAEFSNGAPSNCRALIQANIDGWRAGEFKAKNILTSIEKNCGAMGELWEE